RINNRGAEASHHFYGALGHRVEGRLTAEIESEEFAVHADARAPKRSTPQELSVLSRQAGPGHRPERSLKRAEQDGHIRDRSAHRSGGVLAVGDRDNALL